MKKIICIFVSAMLMAGMLISSVSAVADEIAYPQEGWDDYYPYEILVVLREEYSKQYKEYDASDFPELPLVECDASLSHVTEEYVKDPNTHFHQHCKLVYDSASGLSMEEAMTMIAQNPMVEMVFVNPVIELDIIVTPSPLIGDVNGDGSVDAKDVMLVMNSMAKKEENLDFDFNNDGEVNAKDVMRLIWLILAD